MAQRKPTSELQRIQPHTPGVWTVDDPRIDLCPTSGCWLWILGLNHKGYGVTEIRTKSLQAHRVFWAAKNGPIPDGMHIDHLCKVRSCVNPDHLRCVTPRENTLATNSDSPAAIHARKTHCPKCGGEFTFRQKYGNRFCSPCHKAYQKVWNKEKAKDPEFRARASQRQREYLNRQRAAQ